MSFGSIFAVAPLRRARLAAGLGLLAIALPLAPVLAAPNPYALTPRALAVDYVSKLPGSVADSGQVYAANIHEPRTRTGALHLHGGVFSPIDQTITNAMLGARLGIHMGAPVLFGVSGGWVYHTKSLYDTTPSNLPGLEPRTVLATANAHLIPAMLFVQATLWERFLSPYVGIGGGYEWLLLRAEDFRTDEVFSRTYSGPSWEWYAGVGLKMSRAARLDGEVFYSAGTLGRDVLDPNDNLLRETVDMDGVGLRVGLNIVY
jgi:hypothetical protein